MVAGQKCQTAKFGDFSVQIVANHILIPVGIDGTEQLFILDTGAQNSAVTPEFVQSAQLEATGRKTRNQAIGAITITADVAVPTMSLGGFVIHNTAMQTAALVQPPAPAPQAVGLLGQSVLRAFDMELDLPHGRVALYSTKHCAEGFLPWEPPFSVSKLTTTNQGIVTQAMLDGKGLTALIDTGAAHTLLSDGGLEYFGTSIQNVLKDPAVSASGAGARAIEMHLHRFAKLSVGGASIDQPLLVVGELDIDPRMLLGLDFLMKFRVWISNGTGQIFFAPAEAAPVVH